MCFGMSMNLHKAMYGDFSVFLFIFSPLNHFNPFASFVIQLLNNWHIAVQFWRKIRPSEVCEDHSESRTLCPSQDWTLCLCRVELWVLRNSLFPFSIIPNCYPFCTNWSLSVFFFGRRGFPVWLKYVPGISFRTDNEPFKVLSYLL